MIGQTSSGEFRKSALDEPFIVQVGDQAIVTGNTVTFIRNGVVVATRIISAESEPVPLESQTAESINHVLFFRRHPMPGIVSTLTKVVKNTTTGALNFEFSNGTQRSFSGREQAMTETDYLDTDSVTAEDILIRKTLINSPDDTNLTTVIGGKCSIDMSANNPVTLTIE